MDNTQFFLAFGERLKQAREKKGLTRKALSEAIGLSGSSQITRYESGESLPSVPLLPEISRVLRVDLFWLLTGQYSPLDISLPFEKKRVLSNAMYYLCEYANLLREIIKSMEDTKKICEISSLDPAGIKYTITNIEGDINRTIVRLFDVLKAYYEAIPVLDPKGAPTLNEIFRESILKNIKPPGTQPGPA